MKLIIDIQDFVYNHIKEFNSTQLYELNVITAIKNGLPLPKGHGRLIDADKLLDENIDTFMLQTETKIRIAPTIIEADKEN